MKTIKNVLKLLAFFVVVISILLLADYVAKRFYLSGFWHTLLATLGLAPFALAYLWLDTRQLLASNRLRPGQKGRVVGVRVVASLITAAGVFLALGNNLGIYPSFPYAGSLVLIAGVMFLAFAGNA